jgi:hypothetical protein
MGSDLCVLGDRAVITPTSKGRDRKMLSRTAATPAGIQPAQASQGECGNPQVVFTGLSAILERDSSRWPLLCAALELAAREPAPPHPPSAAAI